MQIRQHATSEPLLDLLTTIHRHRLSAAESTEFASDDLVEKIALLSCFRIVEFEQSKAAERTAEGRGAFPLELQSARHITARRS